MAKEFDPYYEWLGIPPKDQPPNHYRLLGIELFEANRNVIDTAANRQMGFVKEYQTGPHSELTQRLLNELAAARLCLLNQERKAAYDEDLRAKLTAAQVPSRPPPLRPGRNIQRATPAATGTAESEAGVLRRVPMSAPAVEPVLPPAIEESRAKLPAENPVPSRTPRPAESVTWTVVQPAAPATPLRTVGVVAGIAVGLAVAGLAVLLTLWAVPLVRSYRSSALHAAPEEGQHRTHADHPATTAPDISDQPASPADEADPAELPSPDTETAARDDRQDAAAGPVPSPPGRLSADEVADPRPASFTGPRAAPLAPKPNRPASDVAVPADSAAGDQRPEPRELPAPRLPPPASSLRDAIKARVTEQFHPEQAASPAARTRLAKQLLDLADQSSDKHDERFVLLLTAAELSCDGGDVALMIQTIDRLAAGYDVSEPDVQAHMLKRFLLADKEKPERVMAFLRNCDQVISRALAADKLDLAVEMADLAGGLCDRPVGSAEFRKEIQDRQARVRRIGERFKQFQAALARLATAPDDADAHATAGCWLCLVKGNWDEGLPHLSRGSESRFKKLAQQELSAANAAPDVLVALGDGWYEMVQSAEADEQLAMLRRADDWYRRAAESSSGLAKAEIDRRRAEIGRYLARLAPAGLQPTALPDAAKPSPDSAEESESQDLQVLFERALAAGMSGNDFARAERLLSRCNQLDPQHIPTLNNLALMSLRRNNYRRAVHLWGTAAGLAPENAEVKHNLQCLLRLARANRLPLDPSVVSSIERLCAEAGRNDPPRGRSHDGWRFMPYGQSQDYDSSYTDCRCLHCGGTRTVPCNASGCNGGTVGVQRSEVVDRARNGMPIIHKYTVRQPCSRCSGRGTVPCPTCGGTGRSSL